MICALSTSVVRGLHAARHDQLGSLACLKARQACLAPALAAYSQQLSSRVRPFRSSIPHADPTANGEGVADAPEEERPPYVYETDYDYYFQQYACVTGSAFNIRHEMSASRPWFSCTVRSPRPIFIPPQDWRGGEETEVGTAGGEVDEYFIYTEGTLAASAVQKVQEGTMINVGGVLTSAARNQPIPVIFGQTIGVINMPSPEDTLQSVVVPDLPPWLDPFAHMQAAAVAAGAGVTPSAAPAGGAAAAVAAAAAPAPAAGPIRPPGMPDQPSTDSEKLWMSLFLENHLWIDQRATKQGRQPDFKRRERGSRDALWIDSRNTPAWVKASLQMLPGGVGLQLPDFMPRNALNSNYAPERAWADLFINYGSYWDNRLNKRNPRAPDFKHRDPTINTALWIDSNGIPQWVTNNLDKLPAPPPPRT